tara:strand:- start:552 stop:701 length:150 start_codon:yes stop_codon:yes gene_type:complete
MMADEGVPPSTEECVGLVALTDADPGASSATEPKSAVMTALSLSLLLLL